MTELNCILSSHLTERSMVKGEFSGIGGQREKSSLLLTIYLCEYLRAGPDLGAPAAFLPPFGPSQYVFCRNGGSFGGARPGKETKDSLVRWSWHDLLVDSN